MLEVARDAVISYESESTFDYKTFQILQTV